MQFIGIIPARYASTRFPGKPLVEIRGKSMIQRVYEQAKKCELLNKVIVATDDQRIVDHVQSFGGEVMLTSEKHPSGTDRCAEVATKTAKQKDVIVNIQGDEPFIDPKQIALLCDCFKTDSVKIATLVKKIETMEELHNANTPKVIVNEQKKALYFSRSPIPYFRGAETNSWLNKHTYYKHIGMYAYRTDVLEQLSKLPISKLESAESLEQLRWLDNGYSIQVAFTTIETQAVDVPDDLLKFK